MTQFLLRLFVKNADQVSDPKVRAAVGTLSGVVGILCNFFLFLGKVIIGTLSGSVSITADAMNMRRSISALHRRRFSYFRDQLTSG